MVQTAVEPKAQRKPILKVLHGQDVDYIPFWFMRQAGRYLPEYRDIRQKADGFLDMVYNPYTASEITIQPLRRFGMDAAIIFSDILVIPQALGQKLEFVEGEGPKLQPIRNALDLLGIGKILAKDRLEPVYEAISLTGQKLRQEGFLDTTLIGFAGAPWTLACYMIEGQGSKDFAHVKNFMREHPDTFSELVEIVTEAVITHLSQQIDAGAEAIQLFDSWAGYLDGEEFREWVVKPAAIISARLREQCPNIPTIGFPKGVGPNYHSYAKETSFYAIGIDYNLPVEWAAEVLQDQWILQGNLHPKVLKEGDELESETRRILNHLGKKPFVFNLGHGIDKDTPLEHVAQLVELIRAHKIEPEEEQD